MQMGMRPQTNTPFILALLIPSETGSALMRVFTLQHLIRINDLTRIKVNHLKEVVLHRFSLLRVIIASVDATRTRTKAEQIWPNQCQMLHSYLWCRTPAPDEVLGCQQNTTCIISYRLRFYCSCVSSVNLLQSTILLQCNKKTLVNSKFALFLSRRLFLARHHSWRVTPTIMP